MNLGKIKNSINRAKVLKETLKRKRVIALYPVNKRARIEIHALLELSKYYSLPKVWKNFSKFRKKILKSRLVNIIFLFY